MCYPSAFEGPNLSSKAASIPFTLGSQPMIEKRTFLELFPNTLSLLVVRENTPLLRPSTHTQPLRSSKPIHNHCEVKDPARRHRLCRTSAPGHGSTHSATVRLPVITAAPRASSCFASPMSKCGRTPPSSYVAFLVTHSTLLRVASPSPTICRLTSCDQPPPRPPAHLHV